MAEVDKLLSKIILSQSYLLLKTMILYNILLKIYNTFTCTKYYAVLIISNRDGCAVST